jgi:hypothetical protein
MDKQSQQENKQEQQQAQAKAADPQYCYLPKDHEGAHQYEPYKGPIEDESRYCMVSD